MNTKFDNPFSTDFGKIPTYFAGREALLQSITETINDSSTTNLCTLFVGARGSGKTALLSHFGQIAMSSGWIVADVSAIPGMLEDIYERSLNAASHVSSASSPSNNSSTKKLTSINIAPIGGISWEHSNPNLNWRSKMNILLDDLNSKDIGLLITVDEVKANLSEMTELVTTYQHFVREGRKVALLMAGLPYNINALIMGKSTSFMRRAERFELDPLRDYEVEGAFKLTAKTGGANIQPKALELAVKEIDGYPFMFQLIGSHAWRSANIDKNRTITLEHIKDASHIAKQQLEARIYESTFIELSQADREFLNAMLKDKSSTSRENLMQRLNKTSAHITTYKQRLMRAGVIKENLMGNFEFCLPGFKEFLQKILN